MLVICFMWYLYSTLMDVCCAHVNRRPNKRSHGVPHPTHPKISITWSFPQRATAAGLVLVGAIAIAIFFSSKERSFIS
jgi:hypothetical protein